MRKIYKRDSAGKTRVWSQEIDGARYRTIAGIQGGNLVESGWTVCVGKQGRSDAEQAAFEVEANYKHKLSREYHETLETTSAGAHFFKPMLANKFEVFKPGYAQPKSDGARCIATKDGLFSRQGKPFVSVPHISEALAPIFAQHPHLTFDGELYGTALSADFGKIMSLVRQQKPTADDLAQSAEHIQYHIYDLPSEFETFSERSLSLFNTLAGAPVTNGRLVFVETVKVDTPEEYDALHGKWLAEGYEGSMWRADARYDQKRSNSLLKRKSFLDGEFELVSIDEGLGNWSGKAKSIRAKLPDGRIFGAGIKGTAERAVELLNETYKTVTIRYFELTPDGIPRFGVAVDFHKNDRID